MPFSRPTLTQQRQQIAADLLAGLGGEGLLRYSNLGILGEATAGLNEGLYEYLDWIALQSVPFTATDEYLEGWAALKRIIRKPATAATGPITISDGAAEAIVPAGSVFVRSDGASFAVAADVTLDGNGAGSGICTAQAAGMDGNTPAGTVLSLDVAIAGVGTIVVGAGGIAGGAEVESNADLRGRMLIAFAAPAQGGSATDYVEWALAVPGVTRAWANPDGMGAGTVVVWFMMDDVRAAEGGFPQGTAGVAAAESRAAPATGDQLIVADAIYPLRPVTALVYAAAPLVNTIGITIAGIANATAATKAAIAAAFSAALDVNASPGGTTYVSWIEAAIAGVAQSAGFVITDITASAGTITPGAAGNIVSNAGALPVAGVVTYI